MGSSNVHFTFYVSTILDSLLGMSTPVVSSSLQIYNTVTFDTKMSTCSVADLVSQVAYHVHIR